MVIVHVNEHQYSMDGILKDNLDRMRDNLRKNYDCFIVVDGRERFGKSVLASQIAYYMDPTYNINRCCFTAEQFEKCVDEADQKYQAIVLDEAFSALSARQAMSRVNKKLVKVMSEMGFKNLIIIIVLPNFFELDKYPAIHRSNALIHVNKRGDFRAYNYKNKKTLYMAGKKFYSYKFPQCNFYGKFPKFFPLDEEEYNTKKRESVKAEEIKNDKESRYESRWVKCMWRYYNDVPNATIQSVGEWFDLDKTTISKLFKKFGFTRDTE